MQKGRPHAGGKGDERLFLAGQFDLDDAGGGQARLLGADHMQARKAGLAAGAEIDNLRALDQAARLQVDPLLAVFQGQFDPVADQGLARQQGVARRAMGGAKGLDQADAGGVAPDQHRTARHQVAFDPFGPDHPVVAPGGRADQAFKTLEGQAVIAQRMGQIQDRAVLGLPMHPAEHQPLRGRQPVEDHLARLPDGGKLGGVAEQDQHRKDRAQVVELLFVQHRGLVDQAHVQPLLAPFPAADEIRAAQSRRGEGAGDRGVLVMEGLGPVQGGIGHPLDHRAVAAAGQPFGQLFVFRIIDGGVEDAVDRRGRNAAHPQHEGRLVRGRQDRQTAPVPAPPPFVIAADDLDPGSAQGRGDLGQQQRLARSGLADHRHDAALARLRRAQFPGDQVDARGAQGFGKRVPGLGLVGGKGLGGDRTGHAPP